MRSSVRAEYVPVTHVSRPLVALLVGTVLFFALWLVALKPSSGGSANGGTPSGPGGLGQYQSAVNEAKNSVKQQNAQSATAGNIPGTSTASNAASTTPATSTPAPTTPAATPATTAGTAAHAAVRAHAKVHAVTHAKTHAVTHAKTHAVTHAEAAANVSGPRHRYNVIATALREHKVLAVLFYNPAGADDQVVRHELASIPTYRGQVVKLIVPVAELSRYTTITTQVMVSTTPTLVLIGRDRQASTITGFASQFELATRVANAVAAK
jgi:hypothetical protein